MSVVPITEHEPDPWLLWPDGRIHGMFDCKPQAAAWFIKDRLLADRAHVLAGVGGSSKTRAQYHLAVGAVTGRLPWAWDVARTGSSALFLLEDSIDDSHRVLHAIGAQHNEDERQLLTRNLRVFQLAGFPARMLELRGQQLEPTGVYDWLIDKLANMPKPLAYVGIDPALGVTEGDEMSATHQRRLGELMDRIAIQTKACVVLTTHAAKNLRMAEELDSHAARGSGAITDAVRAEFVLRTMTPDEARKFQIDDRAERQRYVQLQATKGNSLPPDAYAAVWLRRGAAGLLEGVTLEQVERGSVGQRELQALELLRQSCESGETSMKHWRGACVAAGAISAGSTAAQEKQMERIRDALRNAGLVLPGKSKGLWQPS